MAKKCNNFIYCNASCHDNIEKCYDIMKHYYAKTFFSKTFYICPGCETSEEIDFEGFLSLHKAHLVSFKRSKLKIFKESESKKIILSKPSTSRNQKTKVSIIKTRPKPSIIIPVKISKVRRCPVTIIKKDLNGSHVTISCDVSEMHTPDIIISNDLIKDLESIVNDMKSAKIQFGLFAEFIKDLDDLKTWRLSNAAERYSEFFIDNGIQALKGKLEKYTETGSGWRISRILEVTFKITKTSDILFLSGSSYIKSPESLSRSGIVNVHNEDNLCFLYSILAIQKYNEFEDNRHRPQKYFEYLNDFQYLDEDMPMKILKISRFERENPGFMINVFIYHDDVSSNIDEEIYKNPHIDIIYRSSMVSGEKINLLLLENNSTFHYLAIINLNNLLNFNVPKISRTRIRCHWCSNCLHGFQLKVAYEKHITLCLKNLQATTMYVMPEKNEVKFDEWSKTITPRFVIYADFESILPSDEKYHQKHLPIAAGLMMLNTNDLTKRYWQFSGEDCIYNFLLCINEIAQYYIMPWYQKNAHKTMIPLNYIEECLFQMTTECYLCKCKAIIFVRDHDHFTGKFLGAACNNCNLSRKVKTTLPVVFHNLKGYDMHHILKHALNKFPTWNISCIPQSTEKFMALFVNFKGMSIKFIDSLQFLNSSLAKLVQNLDGDLPLTKSCFPPSLILSKGIFPYDYATSEEVLKLTYELPPIWNDVSLEEYEKAKNIWILMKCESLWDYMLIYLKLDVFLLADVFQTFRLKSLSEDGLEPLNYFSIPGLSYAAALKGLDHRIELIQDPEMYMFFQNGIRGGMTFVNKHYVKADEETELLYIDINNLYGWALSQKLPHGKFKWVHDDAYLKKILFDCQNLNLETLDYGYVMEVDITIPDMFQDALDDLPVAPEKGCPSGTRIPKLLLTHIDKNNYVIHWRLLQIFISIGAKVTVIHRAVKFCQGYIFAKYINHNTAMRALATNESDRDFYKLKNNSLYGKMIENLLKRINMRICNTEKKLITYTSKAQFRRTIKIADDLISVLLLKDSICLDRPSYIGQAVLDLSKLRMYQLQYIDLEKYRREFKCNIKIIAGDTDSFFLECRNVKLNSQLLPAMQRDKLLDTSNYPLEHPLYSDSLKSVIGKFKDETCGKYTFKEWIFLRPKCYSLLNGKDIEIMKAKGIHVKGSGLVHENYRYVYETGISMSVEQKRIGTVNHQIYTFISSKVALTSMDDKRQWVEKNKSVALGHYRCQILDDEPKEMESEDNKDYESSSDTERDLVSI